MTTVDVGIASVAVLADQPERFRARAAVVASDLGPASIQELSQRFHSPPKPPPAGFGYPERGLGAWLSSWQFAIFEVLFHFGADSLPLLRSVAFGEYDWTQGNAIEVLVRLAAVGTERERTVQQLRQEFPRLRFEATLYAVGPLLQHAQRDQAIASVVGELEDLTEWRDAVEELQTG